MRIKLDFVPMENQKTRLLNVLTHAQEVLAMKRRSEGDEMGGRALLSQAAAKQEYIAALREDKKDGVRNLRHALDLAQQAQDHQRVFNIAMKISQMILWPEMEIPKVELDSKRPDPEMINGLPKTIAVLNESNGSYIYKVGIGPKELDRLLEMLDDKGIGSLVEQSKMEAVVVADNERPDVKIEFRYDISARTFRISSSHPADAHDYVVSLINAIGNTLDSLTSS